MARDGSGTFTLPLADVVAGTDIESTWANTTLTDIETELTDSLSRSGKGGMSAALKLASGTVAAPGLSFTSEADSGLYRNAADDIRFALSGAEAFRVTAAGLQIANALTVSNGNVTVTDGDVTLTAGGIVLSTATEGIDFSANTGTAATGAATTSELFDFYEEGTWTPVLWDTSLSSSEGQTYSTQEGTFTRIGRKVFFECYLSVSSVGTLTGANQVRIGGLPYAASASSPTQTAVFVGRATGLLLAGIYAVSAAINSSASHISMYQFSSTGGSGTLSIAELNTASLFVLSGNYIV